jgi:hypothetical protein
VFQRGIKIVSMVLPHVLGKVVIWFPLGRTPEACTQPQILDYSEVGYSVMMSKFNENQLIVLEVQMR